MYSFITFSTISSSSLISFILLFNPFNAIFETIFLINGKATLGGILLRLLNRYFSLALNLSSRIEYSVLLINFGSFNFIESLFNASLIYPTYTFG